MISAINPLTAGAVILATAATDAVYVMFTSAVVAKKRLPAATWSSIWYMLSSFAVISYTENWVYVLFAAVGSLDRRLRLDDVPASAARRTSGRRRAGVTAYASFHTALHQSPVRCAKRLDAPQQLPYLRRRDTSPQREACYLEG